MVTGAYPARHGITTNLALDPTPDSKNLGGWDPAQGIARVLDAHDIAEQHGAPDAALALEAMLGLTFSKVEGPTPLVPAGDLRGVHGYLPEHPEMRATLIVAGPRIPHTTLHGAQVVDIAPTLAAWLGLSLPESDGKVLPITLRPAPWYAPGLTFSRRGCRAGPWGRRTTAPSNARSPRNRGRARG
jgi:hypothetical protein